VAIGTTGVAQGGPGAAPALITVRVGAATVLANEPVAALRDVWESTSFALEARQCAPACVASERAQLLTRAGPVYKVPPPSPTTPCSRALLLPASEPFYRPLPHHLVSLPGVVCHCDAM